MLSLTAIYFGTGVPPSGSLPSQVQHSIAGINHPVILEILKYSRIHKVDKYKRTLLRHQKYMIVSFF